MPRLGIIFGGRSGEHEISILSAASVIEAVEKLEYEPVPIGINKSGEWFAIHKAMAGIASLDDGRLGALIPKSAREADPGAEWILPGELHRRIDFAFPVLHGPYGEDGKIQGLFEMLGIPYSGCGVAASAICMDKLFTRDIWIRAGLPVCRHMAMPARSFLADPAAAISAISAGIGYPLFVKPANMGSSVGISRVKSADALKGALEEAFRHDRRAIIEEALDCRELEIGATGNGQAEVSAIGEIVPDAEFYDYDSKYRSAGTKLYIPADIPDATAHQLGILAAGAYQALNCEGFSRIDFFLERGTGKLYLNEINTIPGFTRFSMFPSLWREKGVTYPELIERIIRLGNERYNAENSGQTD
ncbi:MAG: D-alanine--D-alanine ligase [Clostridiales Family XIII bacterium]|jgi:D-alanine-D-alanine ligase|nr:D-alanine--D-alanine ligase [Clostridiales Family XIII bacterium]